MKFSQFKAITNGKKRFKQPLSTVIGQKNIFTSEDTSGDKPNTLGKAVLGQMRLG